MNCLADASPTDRASAGDRSIILAAVIVLRIRLVDGSTRELDVPFDSASDAIKACN